MILRDRDTASDWHEQANQVRDERVYYTQNWRGDVSALLTGNGSMIEWYKYSAYGVPFAIPAGDTNSDGTFDEDDVDRMFEPGYDVRKDVNLDGEVDINDFFAALNINDGYRTLGRGVLSSDLYANRRGYAGYEYDPTFQAADRNLYHVRHRVYDADSGRWNRRDPLGYVDGMGLYEYVRSMPIISVDPWGLHAFPAPSGFGGPVSTTDITMAGPILPDPGPGGGGTHYTAPGTIEVRCKPLLDQFLPDNPYHCYIVGRDGQGRPRVCRGGPSGRPPVGGYGLCADPLGLETTCRRYEPGALDYFEPYQDNEGNPLPKEVIDDPDGDVMSCINRHMAAWNCRSRYGFHTHNSNSAVFSALWCCLDHKPDVPTDAPVPPGESAPGWGDHLTDDLGEEDHSPCLEELPF